MLEGDAKDIKKEEEKQQPVVKPSYTWQVINHIMPTLATGTVFAITYYRETSGDTTTDLTQHHSALYNDIHIAMEWTPITITATIFAMTAVTNVILTIFPNAEVHHYYPHHQALQTLNSWTPTALAITVTVGTFITATVFGDRASAANHIITEGILYLTKADRALMIRERLKDHTYDLANDDGSMRLIDRTVNGGEQLITYPIEIAVEAIDDMWLWGMFSRFIQPNDGNKLGVDASLYRAADFVEYLIVNSMTAFARAVKIIADIMVISFILRALGIANLKPVYVIPKKGTELDVSDKVEKILEDAAAGVKKLGGEIAAETKELGHKAVVAAKDMVEDVNAGAKELEHETVVVVEDINTGVKELEHEVVDVVNELDAEAKAVQAKLIAGTKELEHEVVDVVNELDEEAKAAQAKLIAGAKELEHEAVVVIEELDTQVKKYIEHVEEEVVDLSAQVQKELVHIEEEVKELVHPHAATNVVVSGVTSNEIVTPIPTVQHHGIGHILHHAEEEFVGGMKHLGHEAHEAEKKFVHGIGHIGSGIIHGIHTPYCGSSHNVVTEAETKKKAEGKKADSGSQEKTTQNSADGKSSGDVGAKKHAAAGGNQYNDESQQQSPTTYLASLASKPPKEISFSIVTTPPIKHEKIIVPESDKHNKTVAEIVKALADLYLVKIQHDESSNSTSCPELPSDEQKLFLQPFLINSDSLGEMVKIAGAIMPDIMPGMIKAM